MSARERNSNAGPAGLALFAAWMRRERWGFARTVAAKCGRRQSGAQGTGGRATVHGIAALGGRCRGASPQPASSAKAGTGTMVKPWAAPLSTTSGTPRCKTASDTTGAQGNPGATVRDHRSKGLRFRALGTPDRQLDTGQCSFSIAPKTRRCKHENCRLARHQPQSPGFPVALTWQRYTSGSKPMNEAVTRIFSSIAGVIAATLARGCPARH